MKLLLDVFACWGSSSSEEKRLLAAVKEPQRLVAVGRKRGRMRGGGLNWRPSLSSISENNVFMMAERTNNNNRNNDERPVAAAASGWRRKLKRKLSSMSQREHNRSFNFDHDDARLNPLSAIQPSFSPTFMF